MGILLEPRLSNPVRQPLTTKNPAYRGGGPACAGTSARSHGSKVISVIIINSITIISIITIMTYVLLSFLILLTS